MLLSAVKSEAVVRYFEKMLRRTEGRIEKYRVQHKSIRRQLRQLKNNPLNTSTDRDVIQYIDFHRLRIEVALFSRTYATRTAELLRAKLALSNTVTLLNTMQSRLATLLKDNLHVQECLNARKVLIQKLLGDTSAVRAESQIARKEQQVLLLQARIAADIPTVSDYIVLTRAEDTLRGALLDCRRKIDIAALKFSHLLAKSKHLDIHCSPEIHVLARLLNDFHRAKPFFAPPKGEGSSNGNTTTNAAAPSALPPSSGAVTSENAISTRHALNTYSNTLHGGIRTASQNQMNTRQPPRLGNSLFSSYGSLTAGGAGGTSGIASGTAVSVAARKRDRPPMTDEPAALLRQLEYVSECIVKGVAADQAVLQRLLHQPSDANSAFPDSQLLTPPTGAGLTGTLASSDYSTPATTPSNVPLGDIPAVPNTTVAGRDDPMTAESNTSGGNLVRPSGTLGLAYSKVLPMTNLPLSHSKSFRKLHAQQQLYQKPMDQPLSRPGAGTGATTATGSIPPPDTSLSHDQSQSLSHELDPHRQNYQDDAPETNWPLPHHTLGHFARVSESLLTKHLPSETDTETGVTRGLGGAEVVPGPAPAPGTLGGSTRYSGVSLVRPLGTMSIPVPTALLTGTATLRGQASKSGKLSKPTVVVHPVPVNPSKDELAQARARKLTQTQATASAGTASAGAFALRASGSAAGATTTGTATSANTTSAGGTSNNPLNTITPEPNYKAAGMLGASSRITGHIQRPKYAMHKSIAGYPPLLTGTVTGAGEAAILLSQSENVPGTGTGAGGTRRSVSGKRVVGGTPVVGKLYLGRPKNYFPNVPS